MTDIHRIRVLILQAVASDSELVKLLVLKGGNALDLVYQFDSRTSLDIDFSLESSLEDLENIKDRLFTALRKSLGKEGLVLFDEGFVSKPKTAVRGSKWMGYEATFKIVKEEVFRSHEHSITELRKRSLSVVGGAQGGRTFTIQFSQFEWVKGAELFPIVDGNIRVYSLAMLAIEKLRAICQQMEDYSHRSAPTPRARDFFDIYEISQKRPLHLEKADTQDMVKSIFDAKEVPYELLGKLDTVRDFHIRDWASVVNSVKSTPEEFDFYFQFLIRESRKLEPLWKK